MKKFNFSAGPAILPAPVIREAAKAVANYQGIGLSLLELSHRSAEVTAIMEEAQSLMRDLLSLPDNYHVLWMSGGASSQFYLAPMNFLNEDETAAYIDTGAWSAKAIKEARAFGDLNILASTKAENYTRIPKRYKIPADSKYLHITSNNTIFGTQFHKFPETDIPMVADMSSDFLSRPIDVERFGMIYAGAQKNLGPAGVTAVIIRDDMVGKVRRHLPSMNDYRSFIEKKSLYNTAPVYPIYVCMLTLRWLKGQGGTEAIERKNKSKARLLYKEIDNNPVFHGTVARPDRSHMNVCFVMANGYESLQDEFLDLCKENGLVGLKGHRSVGGFRASIYNAFPRKGVKALVDLMQDFAAKKG